MIDILSDIIKRCKHGDRAAQEAVYNMFAAKMFAVCMRYCSNYEDARDLLHDGFMTIFTKIKQFRNTGSFEGWIRRIFVNQAMERYRSSAKVEILNFGDDSDLYLVDSEDKENDVREEHQLTMENLLAMVEGLPQQYKIVFNLYVIDGLSHRDIAEKLGISEGTSRSNLLRARGFMQKQVNNTVDSTSVKSNAIK